LSGLNAAYRYRHIEVVGSMCAYLEGVLVVPLRWPDGHMGV